MSWFAQTEEAKKHIEECEGCEKCIWIEESAYAMTEYGVIKETEKHPLYDLIKEKFHGKEID